METISSYLETLSNTSKSRVFEVLALADEILLEADKSLVYQIPTYRLRNRNVFHVAGYDKHIGIYPGPKLIEAFSSQLQGYKISKGTWQIQHTQTLPLPIIVDMLKRIYNDSL